MTTIARRHEERKAEREERDFEERLKKFERSSERTANLRPPRYRDDDEILDKFNVLVSADAAQAIALLGHKSRMKTTRWAFEKGLDRWERLREVRDFLAARHRLDKAGSAEVHQFNHWQPVLTGSKRYCLYGVTKRQAKRCADLGSGLGVGTERMAGLCIDAGILDAVTVPIPTNHRLARSLRHVRADLRDRLHRIERLCDGDPADLPRIITWDEVMGERKSRGKSHPHGHTGGRGTVGNRRSRSLNTAGGRGTVGNRRT